MSILTRRRLWRLPLALGLALPISLSVAGAASAAEAGSLKLMDARTNTVIRDLTSGQSLDRNLLPSNIDVTAIPLSTRTGSVKFCLDGVCRTESTAPYTLDNSSDKTPWSPAAGSHTLVVTTYSGAAATGSVLGSSTVSFTVVPVGSTTPPAPNESPAPEPARPIGTTLFQDAWSHDSSCGSFRTMWAQCHAAAPDRIQVGQYAGRTATIMRVNNADVYPRTPTVNPRAQVNTKNIHFEGQISEDSWGTNFGADYPMNPKFSIFYQFHGAPYSGSPRIGFGVAGGRMHFARDDVYGYDRPWLGPAVVPGRWYDFAVRVKWSKSPSVGWVELKLNGVPQTFKNGSTRLPMATIQSDQSGVESIVANYRALNSAQWATIATSAVRVATL